MEAGIRDLLILKKPAGLGDIWNGNVRPGCACDVVSSVSSFSFAHLKASRAFPSHGGILKYLQDVAELYCLMPRFRFQWRVLEAVWNGDNLSSVAVRTYGSDEWM